MLHAFISQQSKHFVTQWMKSSWTNIAGLPHNRILQCSGSSQRYIQVISAVGNEKDRIMCTNLHTWPHPPQLLNVETWRGIARRNISFTVYLLAFHHTHLTGLALQHRGFREVSRVNAVQGASCLSSDAPLYHTRDFF